MKVEFTREQWETPLAELEVYGLSPRTCGLLEDKFGCLYVGDLSDVTEEMLLERPLIGEGAVAEVKRALSNFLMGKPVKTIDECVEM